MNSYLICILLLTSFYSYFWALPKRILTYKISYCHTTRNHNLTMLSISVLFAFNSYFIQFMFLLFEVWFLQFWCYDLTMRKAIVTVEVRIGHLDRKGQAFYWSPSKKCWVLLHTASMGPVYMTPTLVKRVCTAIIHEKFLVGFYPPYRFDIHLDLHQAVPCLPLLSRVDQPAILKPWVARVIDSMCHKPSFHPFQGRHPLT